MQEFNVKKAVQALYYVQNRTRAGSTLELLKMLFFADRWQLRNTSMPLLCDTYYAMKMGPVSSDTYNILKKDKTYLGTLCAADRELVERHIQHVGENGHEVRIEPTDESALSPMNKQALDFSVRYFGSFDRFSLSDITHAYPEWNKFADKFDGTQKGRSPRYKMDYADFFGDASPHDQRLKKYLGGKDPFKMPQKDLHAAKAVFDEYRALSC